MGTVFENCKEKNSKHFDWFPPWWEQSYVMPQLASHILLIESTDTPTAHWTGLTKLHVPVTTWWVTSLWVSWPLVFRKSRCEKLIKSVYITAGCFKELLTDEWWNMDVVYLQSFPRPHINQHSCMWEAQTFKWARHCWDLTHVKCLRCLVKTMCEQKWCHPSCRWSLFHGCLLALMFLFTLNSSNTAGSHTTTTLSSNLWTIQQIINP